MCWSEWLRKTLLFPIPSCPSCRWTPLTAISGRCTSWASSCWASRWASPPCLWSPCTNETSKDSWAPRLQHPSLTRTGAAAAAASALGLLVLNFPPQAKSSSPKPPNLRGWGDGWCPPSSARASRASPVVSYKAGATSASEWVLCRTVLHFVITRRVFFSRELWDNIAATAAEALLFFVHQVLARCRVSSMVVPWHFSCPLNWGDCGCLCALLHFDPLFFVGLFVFLTWRSFCAVPLFEQIFPYVL